MGKTLRDYLQPQPKSKVKAGQGMEVGMYKFFTSSAVQSKYLDEYSYDEPALIFGTGGSASVHYCDEPFSTSTDCIVTYAKDFVDLKLLYYYLSGNIVLLQNGFKGAGLQHISKDYILDIPFEMPSKDLVRDIVSSFDYITDLSNMIKRQNELFDKMVKSRFVGMFGELRLNSMAWDEYPLGLICDKVVRYPTFYGMEYLPSGTRVIRIGNILPDGHMELDDENYVFVYDTVNEDFPETVIELNDIIMAVRGDGSAAKRIGIVTEPNLIDANISPNLIRIKVNNAMLNPIYMFYYLTGEVGQKRLDAYVNKTAKKNIAAKDIVKIVTPVPPLPLQNDFAAFVREIDKSKFCV